MCMMSAKTIISNNMMMGKTPKDIITDTNKTFCEHNDECMFVTAWIAILEIPTGKLSCVNAGHEYPMIKQKNQDFAIYEDKHGSPIGWISSSEYEEYVIQLMPGDMIFVYTDGITEAKNKNGEMFGTDRIIDTLNRNAKSGCETLLKEVWNDVNIFAEGVEQFDDLTMLCMEYRGMENQEKRDELVVEALTENLPQVTAFVDARLEAADCPMKAQMQIDVAVEEIFVNIAGYAYAPEIGMATVRVEVSEEPLTVTITFIDHGVPYDPLAKEDPDVTLSAEQRELGGLGIFMTKKLMDDVSYEYKDGQNILTLRKKL